MSHYFIENAALLTNERMLTANILGQPLKFLSNNGLFACDKVDEISTILIENMPPIAGSLLDLGCGYGTIGIALAKKYPLQLTFADINSIALAYAVKNAALNQVKADAIHSDSFEKIEGKFDTITLNPPIHAGKDTMYKMYAESAQHLNPGGAFYIVIQKKHGADSTIKKLKEIFSTVDTIYKKKGCLIVKNCI